MDERRDVATPERARAGVARAGYVAGLVAFAAACAYVIVQMMQVAGALRFPLDAILIYGSSLCIATPFVLAMLALHHLAPPERRYWSHAAVLFTVLYAGYVDLNYVVQLATVIPATLRGTVGPIRVLDQTPHSLFWDVDALGYVMMGMATLCAVPVFGRTRLERWARGFFLANALVTPLISVVYFAPTFSTGLLMLGLPWGVTAPGSILLLALVLRRGRVGGAGA